MCLNLTCSAISSLRLDAVITVIVVAAGQFGKQEALGLGEDSRYLRVCM